MSTALSAPPDAPVPRREARTALAMCLLYTCGTLVGHTLVSLVRMWLAPAAD